jgi:hypothetical protein
MQHEHTLLHRLLRRFIHLLCSFPIFTQTCHLQRAPVRHQESESFAEEPHREVSKDVCCSARLGLQWKQSSGHLELQYHQFYKGAGYQKLIEVKTAPNGYAFFSVPAKPQVVVF